jgi:voltage-gated potassium channel
MELRKRLRDTVLAVLLIFLTGVVGYEWIEGWGLLDSAYMTVITLATIGYGETHPLSDGGRVFTIFLIFSGISTFSYGAFTLTSLIAEGSLQQYLRRKRMDKAIARLQDHFIVCGAGHLALHTIGELLRTGKRVVVIDRNAESLQAFQTRESLEACFGKNALAGQACYIEGDAAADKTLSEANIQQACGVFCVLPDDKDNLFVVLSARGLNRGVRIVAKCIDDQSAEKFTRAGADIVVSPNRIGGLRMASEMLRPTVVSFLDVMVRDPQGYRFEEVLVAAASPYVGQSIRQSPLGTTPGVRVVALVAADKAHCYNPPEETVLSPGQRLVILGRSTEVEALRQAVNQGARE